MSDLEGEDMILLERFGKRPSAASVAGRRTRETRPLAVADRRLISHRTKQPAPKRLQLNLKVLPDFHERVSAAGRYCKSIKLRNEIAGFRAGGGHENS